MFGAIRVILPLQTSSRDRHSAGSAAEPHCLGAIAKIQIEATAAYFRSGVHDRVCSVVSTVQARQSDHRAKWQDAWIGRNDPLGDSRPCRRGFACAIRGDGEGHGLGKLNAGRLSRPGVSCATLGDNQCADRDACGESRSNHFEESEATNDCPHLISVH